MPAAVLTLVFAALPGWVRDGLLLGLAASLVVAGLFYLLVRYFPGEQSADHGVDTETRRREEIAGYLDRIGEEYVADSNVAGQQVAFYLPVRDVAITFDARTYYRLAHTDTDSVLVEHELPGVALGYRLPFETPTVEADDGQPRPREAAHAVLGLPAEATVEEINGAYREKIKQAHPDHGGDRAEFERVRDAYTTAKKHAE